MFTSIRRCLITLNALLMMALLANSCVIKMGIPGPYLGDETALYTMVTYSVPGTDEMGTIIRRVDEDCQGRILFEVSFTNSEIYYNSFDKKNSRIIAYAVCQCFDTERVYYYEDDCYSIYADANEFTVSEQKMLKESNDWDKPMDFTKMIEKAIISKDKEGRKTYDSYTLEKAEKAFKKEIDITNANTISTRYFDKDGQGRVLYTVVVLQNYHWKKTNDNGVRLVKESIIQPYLMIYDSKNSREQVFIERIEDSSKIRQQIKEFKQNFNWGR